MLLSTATNERSQTLFYIMRSIDMNFQIVGIFNSHPKQQSKVILMAKWCHLTMSLRHKMATSGWCHYFKVKMMYYVKVILMSLFDISLTLLISFCHQNDFDLPSYWCQNDVWMRSNWDYNLKIVSKKYQTTTSKWRLHSTSFWLWNNDIILMSPVYV